MILPHPMLHDMAMSPSRHAPAPIIQAAPPIIQAAPPPSMACGDRFIAGGRLASNMSTVAAPISMGPQVPSGTIRSDEFERRAKFNRNAAQQLLHILEGQRAEVAFLKDKSIEVEAIENYGSSSTVQIKVYLYDEISKFNVAQPTQTLMAKYVPQHPYRERQDNDADFRAARIKRLMREGQVQKIAGEHGFAAKVCRLDEENGYILQEFLSEGSPDGAEQNIAQLLGGFHSLKIKLPAENPLHQNEYLRLEEKRLFSSELFKRPCGKLALDAIHHYVATLKQIVELLPKVVSAVHGDVMTTNIVFDKNKDQAQLIDFEHASYADPMADLAYYAHHIFDSQKLLAMVAAHDLAFNGAKHCAYERLIAHNCLLLTRGLATALREHDGNIAERVTSAISDMRRGLSLLEAAGGVKKSKTLTHLTKHAGLVLDIFQIEFEGTQANNRFSSDDSPGLPGNSNGLHFAGVESEATDRFLRAMQDLGIDINNVEIETIESKMEYHFFRVKQNLSSRTEAKDLFVKVRRGATENFSEWNEPAMALWAGEHGFGPRAFLTPQAMGVLVVEYICGRTLNRKEISAVDNRPNLQQVLARMREWHDVLPEKNLFFPVDYSGAARASMEALKDKKIQGPFDPSQLLERAKQLNEMLDGFLLSHVLTIGDIHAGNMMVATDEVLSIDAKASSDDARRFYNIDLEGAAWRPRIADLTRLAFTTAVNAKDLPTLLRDYWCREPTQEEILQLRIFAALNNIDYYGYWMQQSQGDGSQVKRMAIRIEEDEEFFNFKSGRQSPQ